MYEIKCQIINIISFKNSISHTVNHSYDTRKAYGI